ncbi:MerR family transcriptional regulator [Paucibacter sp. APW11]|uniref:MerR family transcriptional regulator n=1 Tax=Roseateles aquae TaxID=3077235 RepID=A0ABU3PER0_9BURK|nr:MerR family transcriptional regulator [Paucibacter sp. APW11]MDT9000637.1 MerR family transcriptional regulator [Paucibacter sp. APW11]
MNAAARLTLGQLAKRVGLARTSVLHYETLGLLRPRARSDAGYRLYGEAELERLQRICQLRQSGLALADIQLLLRPMVAGNERRDAGPRALLERRLLGLSQEVEHLRRQQRLLAQLLAAPGSSAAGPQWDKAAWVELLRRAGFDDAAMQLWHTEFERDDPQEHARFLASLGCSRSEIARIRRWSRPSAEPASGA